MDNYYQQSQFSQEPQRVNPIHPPTPEPPKTFGWFKWILLVGIVALLSSAATYLVVKSQSTEKPSRVAQSTPKSENYLQNSASNQNIDPAAVDLKELLSPNMELSKKLLIDFNGDGQKEIVLIGTDKEHKLASQAELTKMPLILVYQYSTVTKIWSKVAEADYRNFSTDYGQAINQIVIVSLGKQQGLAITYAAQGSRVNEKFLAVVGDDTGVIIFNFPESLYKERGGKTPHQVFISADGVVTVYEGLYKQTDSNNEPSDGRIKSIFKLDSTGIHLEDFKKEPFNLIYLH